MSGLDHLPGPHACAPAAATLGLQTPAACPKDGQPGEGECLTPAAPHEGTRHPAPPGRPSCHPHSAQRQLASACAVGLVPGPHTRTPAPRRHGQQASTACPKARRPREGERLTPDASHNNEGWRLRGTARHPCGKHRPAGHARQRASAASPRLSTRIHSKWAADPGGGSAPNPRRPSRKHKATPRGTPSWHYHSGQHQLARACAVGFVPGPHTHTPRAGETRTTGPAYPPQGRAAGRGRAPNLRRSSQRAEDPPLANLQPPPWHASPSETRMPKGQCRVPTAAHPRPQRLGSGLSLPPRRAGGRGRVIT